MKEINFKQLSVETGIDSFETMDLSKEIGNTIHRNAISVPMSELARGVYHSKGPVRVSDEDYNAMLSIIEKSYALIVVEAIKRGTTNVKHIEEESHD